MRGKRQSKETKLPAQQDHHPSDIAKIIMNALYKSSLLVPLLAAAALAQGKRSLPSPLRSMWNLNRS
jgi:hypothetical protein